MSMIQYDPITVAYGLMGLGIAYAIGLLGMLFTEHIRAAGANSGGKNLRQNIRTSRDVLKKTVLEKEHAAAVSGYRDPHVDWLVESGQSGEALEYCKQRRQLAFEQGNDDLVRLYSDYIQSLSSDGGNA